MSSGQELITVRKSANTQFKNCWSKNIPKVMKVVAPANYLDVAKRRKIKTIQTMKMRTGTKTTIKKGTKTTCKYKSGGCATRTCHHNTALIQRASKVKMFK